jgi:hypothetical protein
LQTISIAIRVQNHGDCGQQEKQELQQKFTGNIVPQTSAEQFIKKFSPEPIEFVLVVKRNDVYTFITNDWELILFGNSVLEMINECIKIINDISITFNTNIHIDGINEVVWIGFKLTRKEALMNLGISGGAAFVAPVLSIFSNPTSPPPESLITVYLIAAAVFFGVGTLIIYLIRR